MWSIILIGGTFVPIPLQFRIQQQPFVTRNYEKHVTQDKISDNSGLESRRSTGKEAPIGLRPYRSVLRASGDEIISLTYMKYSSEDRKGPYWIDNYRVLKPPLVALKTLTSAMLKMKPIRHQAVTLEQSVLVFFPLSLISNTCILLYSYSLSFFLCLI